MLKHLALQSCRLAENTALKSSYKSQYTSKQHESSLTSANYAQIVLWAYWEN